MGGSLPFRSGVVVSLRPLSVCHGSLWLVTALFTPRDGVTPARSRIVCPRSDRRFSLSIWVRYTGHFLAGPPASVCGFLRALFLRVCCQVVLAVSLTFGFP